MAMSQHLRKMIDVDAPKVVWKYIELDKKVNPPDFIQYAMRYSNMFIQPIAHILFWSCYFFFPDLFLYFGGSLETTWFSILLYIASSLQVVWNAIKNWSEAVEHYHLGTTLFTWKILARGLGLPLITIQSPDKNHQYFKYAAAISLLQDFS